MQVKINRGFAPLVVLLILGLLALVVFLVAKPNFSKQNKVNENSETTNSEQTNDCNISLEDINLEYTLPDSWKVESVSCRFAELSEGGELVKKREFSLDLSKGDYHLIVNEKHPCCGIADALANAGLKKGDYTFIDIKNLRQTKEYKVRSARVNPERSLELNEKGTIVDNKYSNLFHSWYFSDFAEMDRFEEYLNLHNSTNGAGITLSIDYLFPRNWDISTILEMDRIIQTLQVK